MSRAIVCGLDGSPDSGAALEAAAYLSRRLGSRFVLAHIDEVAHVPTLLPTRLGDGGTDGGRERDRRRGESG